MEVGVFTDVSGEQSCVSCWDLKTGVMLKSFKNGNCAEKGLDVSKNLFVYAAQHDSQIIHVYAINKEQLVKKIVCPEKVSALAVSPDGFYLVVALVEKIYVWQVSTGNLMCILSKHFQTINGVHFTKDSRFFVSYGKDNLLLVWDFNKVAQFPSNTSSQNEISPMHVLSHHSMSIEDIHIGFGGVRCYMVTCSIDQTCKIFDLCSGVLLKNFVFDVMCTAVTMDIMEKKLFVGTNEGAILRVNCYSQISGQEEHVDENNCTSFKGHKKKMSCLRVTYDGLQLLSASYDCTVKLWHIQSMQCIRTFEFKGEITNILLLPFNWFQPNSTCVVLPKENFKRVCYLPGEFDMGEMTYDVTDTIPVLLKDVHGESDPSKNYLDEVLKEHDACAIGYKSFESQSNKSLWSQSNKTITRTELIRKISILEAITQKFYGVSTENLLTKTNSEEPGDSAD